MPIRVWRICKARFASTPLSGEGARLYGGRWNEPGTAVVYTSSTLALAQLETLVHVDRVDAPRDLVAIELSIPGGIAVAKIAPASLPRGWRGYPAPAVLATMATKWARSLRTAVLRVPSAVVPQEFDYVLNPAHGDASRIEVIETTPVLFDARLFPKRKPRTPTGAKARKGGATRKKRKGRRA